MPSKRNEKTPPEVLEVLADFLKPIHGALLDPCAGDGETLGYLAEAWSASRYGVEPDDIYYHQMVKSGVKSAMSGYFRDIYAKDFVASYVFPPPDAPAGNFVRWCGWMFEAIRDNGVIVWRVPERIVKNPAFIEAFVARFYEAQFFKDIPDLDGSSKDLYVIRCRRRKEVGEHMDEVQDLVVDIERAVVLGSKTIYAWDTPYSGNLVFRIRGLEWEDIYEELYEYSWPLLTIPGGREDAWFSYRLKAWREAIEAGEDPHETSAAEPPEKAYWQVGSEVWCDAFATYQRGIYVLSMVGRKRDIQILEKGLKSSQLIHLGRYSKGKLQGGGTVWKENYTAKIVKLPKSGAFHAVWLHNNATPRATDEELPGLLPLGSRTVAAQIVANTTGLPVLPEWVNDIMDQTGYVDKKHRDGIHGEFKHMFGGEIQRYMTQMAANGTLDEPMVRNPEVLRPIMPPSTGIWAQLAMQEFVNDIPLPGGIVMHAKPVEIEDTEVGEALDKRIEVTTILRKDAVRVSVFHYLNNGTHMAGDWEIFQTETADDVEDEDDEDEDYE